MSTNNTQNAPQQGDLYLQFPDEATARQVLADYPGQIDMIGVIARPTGELVQTALSAQTVVWLPRLQALPGWHVNIRGPITPNLQDWAVQPQNPSRVWA